MDLGALLLLLALLVGVGLFLAAPLMNNRLRHFNPETQEASSLMAERDRLINALQELDFDYKLGKIPEADYPLQRAELLQKGADILRKLDGLSPGVPSTGNDAGSRLEQAAAAQRGDAPAGSGPPSDDEIESMLATRRKERRAKSSGFCPHCGKPVLVSDRFCPNCGKAVK